jgi:hypothetical protein
MATQVVQGPPERADETYGKMAGLAMMLFAIFGCVMGIGLGAALMLWLRP